MTNRDQKLEEIFRRIGKINEKCNLSKRLSGMFNNDVGQSVEVILENEDGTFSKIDAVIENDPSFKPKAHIISDM